MFLRWILVGFLLAAGLFASASWSPPARTSAKGAAGAQMIRTETVLVALPVTVKDHHGQFVSGLTQKDFEVYENGKLQTISSFQQNDVPVTVGLVIDGSGSMGPNRSEVAEGARDFLAYSNPEDQIFIVNFNERVSLGLRPTIPFTSDVSELEAAVLRGPSTGMTALYDATAFALKHLALGTAEKKALVIISDGGDDASRLKFPALLQLAEHGNAIIYTIGIIGQNEADVNPGVLRRLAKATGGDAYFPQSAEDLPGICRQIARDLRKQYTIGYVPADTARDGTFRAVRVSVRAPGHGRLVVRTREGYFAPSGPGRLR